MMAYVKRRPHDKRSSGESIPEVLFALDLIHNYGFAQLTKKRRVFNTKEEQKLRDVGE